MVKRILAAAAAFGASWGTQGTMVLNQGQDAAPQLPAIEAVLTKADGKAVDFAAQAMAMQKMVEESQRKGRDALASQKADYEKQLTEQATANRAVVDRNTAISDQIAHVRKSNDELKGETASLQAGNSHMRKILQQISEKVDAANLFVSDSLKMTDDSSAEELKVLMPTTPRPTLNHFLEEAGASLLQISKPDHGSNTPEDLVQVLSRSLGDIADAQKEGAAELKAHFLAQFEDGRVKQQELLAQQKTLNTTLDEQMSYQKELTAARDHLVSTRDSLKQRLHGLRIFARKLDQTAHDVLATDSVKMAQNFMESRQASLVDKAHAKATAASTTAPPTAAPKTTVAQTTAPKMTAAPSTTVAPSTAAPSTTPAPQVLIAKSVSKVASPKPNQDGKPKDGKPRKLAALVEASSKNVATQAEKPTTSVKEIAAKEAAPQGKKTTAQVPAASARAPAVAATKTKTEDKEPSSNPPSRIQSWFASWR